jgi:hypothetical protein
MNDVEKDLKVISRRGPSAGLDARVERSLQNAAPVFSRPVPLWACALATVIGIAAGAILVRLPVRDDLAGSSTGILIANVEAQASSFPFIGRSFVQP